MSLTAHFIGSDWQLRTACLRTEYHPESHTSSNIAAFIVDGLHEYGLRKGEVVAITTDSAANMVAAARDSGKLSYEYVYLTDTVGAFMLARAQFWCVLVD